MTPLTEKNRFLTEQNELFKVRNEELAAQVADLTKITDEWTKSRVTMDQILGSQKASGDKDGLGFSSTSENFKCAVCSEKEKDFTLQQTFEIPKAKLSDSKGKGQDKVQRQNFHYVYPKKQTGKAKKAKAEPAHDISYSDYGCASTSNGNSARKGHAPERQMRILKRSAPKPQNMVFVKTQFISGFHHCVVCDGLSHKAAECLLRFAPNAKGRKNPKVRQEWVVKSC